MRSRLRSLGRRVRGDRPRVAELVAVRRTFSALTFVVRTPGRIPTVARLSAGDTHVDLPVRAVDAYTEFDLSHADLTAFTTAASATVSLVRGRAQWNVGRAALSRPAVTVPQSVVSDGSHVASVRVAKTKAGLAIVHVSGWEAA